MHAVKKPRDRKGRPAFLYLPGRELPPPPAPTPSLIARALVWLGIVAPVAPKAPLRQGVIFEIARGRLEVLAVEARDRDRENLTGGSFLRSPRTSLFVGTLKRLTNIVLVEGEGDRARLALTVEQERSLIFLSAADYPRDECSASLEALRRFLESRGWVPTERIGGPSEPPFRRGAPRPKSS